MIHVPGRFPDAEHRIARFLLFRVPLLPGRASSTNRPTRRNKRVRFMYAMSWRTRAVSLIDLQRRAGKIRAECHSFPTAPGYITRSNFLQLHLRAGNGETRLTKLHLQWPQSRRGSCTVPLLHPTTRLTPPMRKRNRQRSCSTISRRSPLHHYDLVEPDFAHLRIALGRRDDLRDVIMPNMRHRLHNHFHRMVGRTDRVISPCSPRTRPHWKPDWSARADHHHRAFIPVV